MKALAKGGVEREAPLSGGKGCREEVLVGGKGLLGEIGIKINVWDKQIHPWNNWFMTSLIMNLFRIQ